MARAPFLQKVFEPLRFERTGPKAAAGDERVEGCHRRVLGVMPCAKRIAPSVFVGIVYERLRDTASHHG